MPPRSRFATCIWVFATFSLLWWVQYVSVIWEYFEVCPHVVAFGIDHWSHLWKCSGHCLTIFIHDHTGVPTYHICGNERDIILPCLCSVEIIYILSPRGGWYRPEVFQGPILGAPVSRCVPVSTVAGCIQNLIFSLCFNSTYMGQLTSYSFRLFCLHLLIIIPLCLSAPRDAQIASKRTCLCSKKAECFGWFETRFKRSDVFHIWW